MRKSASNTRFRQHRPIIPSFNFLNEVCDLSVFQVIGLTETWLNDHNSALLNIPGYNFYNRNRQFRQHGGNGAYIRSDIEVLVRNDLVVYQEMVFEPFILQLRLKPNDAFVIILYRPPSGSIPIFMDLLDKQLEKLATSSHPFMMLGDFNIDLSELDASVSIDFLQLCMSYGLFPTINICIQVTTSSSQLIDNIFSNLFFSAPRVIITDVSDHFGISTRFDLCIPQKLATIIPKSPMHVFSQSNLQKFKQAIAKVDWNNLIDLTDDINTSFQRFYDKLILLVTKTFIMVRSSSRKNNPKKPWMSPSLLRCINKRDKLYKNSINNGNDPICLRIYKNYRNALNKLLRNAKKIFRK